MKRKLIVFATGTKSGGGSGFEALVNATRTMDPQTRRPILDAEIVAVVSNHEHGGVREKANRLGIPFIYFAGPYTAEAYQKIVGDTGAGWVALSGWLKLVLGLDPRRSINIHPGPLPRFGGTGMYGHHVHDAVHTAFQKREIRCSAVSMHFVTEKYDEGPVFFRREIELFPDDTPESIGTRVNVTERLWQPIITNLVVQEQIRWDGKDPQSLIVPKGIPY